MLSHFRAYSVGLFSPHPHHLRPPSLPPCFSRVSASMLTAQNSIKMRTKGKETGGRDDSESFSLAASFFCLDGLFSFHIWECATHSSFPWACSLLQFLSMDVSPPYPVIVLCSRELALIMTHCLTPSGLRRKAPNTHSQHLPVPNGLSTTIS